MLLSAGLLNGTAVFAASAVVLNDGDDYTNGAALTATTGSPVVSTNTTPDPLTIGTFINNGTITSDDATAVMFGNAADSHTGPVFTNKANVGVFINNGTITGTVNDAGNEPYVGYGVWFTGNTTSFTNNGTISGQGLVGAKTSGNATTVLNNGLIEGLYVGFSNDGTAAMTLTNNGTIRSTTNDTAGQGVVITEGTLINNAGAVISGYHGILSNGANGTTIVNQGSILAHGGKAIFFGNRSGPQFADDILKLLPGAKIAGLVDFADDTAGDLLDMSAFTGNIIVSTDNLEKVDVGTGAQSFSAFTSQQVGSQVFVRSDEQLAAVDVGGVTGGSSGGGGGATASFMGGISQITEIASAQLSGFGDFSAPQPLAYAAQPQSSAEEAVLTQLSVDDPAARKVWVSGLGGGSQSVFGASRQSLFGGIVAGTHESLNSATQLGGLAGVVISSGTSGQQTVVTKTGVAGFYGDSDVERALLSYGLLGGYNFHSSSRDTGGLGTASADFTSWFLAPRIGISLPVLENDGSDVRIGLSSQYVAGQVSSYTETGSGANLTVGGQTIGLLDTKAEVTGTRMLDDNVRLLAKGGVSLQANLGSSTVPITVLGTTVNAAVPGGVVYGAHGGLGVSVSLSDDVDLTAMADASIRSDGLASGAGTIRLTGSY